MTLCIDIGNTTIALSGIDGEYNVLFAEKIPSDEHFNKPLERVLGGFAGIENAVLSSVAPRFTEPVCRTVKRIIGIEPKVIDHSSYRGFLSFAIPEPEKLGLDRIADSAWAAAKYPLPAVTVDLGTASTFNVIAEGGVFLGGIIAAGLQTSFDALSQRAAQLPKIPLSSPQRLIGKNTVDCMLSGAVIGAASMIDGIVFRIENELSKSVTLILTGGGAKLVEPFLLHNRVFEPYLLAKGLVLTVN